MRFLGVSRCILQGPGVSSDTTIGQPYEVYNDTYVGTFALR